MRVAVTGASGFVGQAVLSALSRRGHVAVGCAHQKGEAISGLGHEAVIMDLHQAPADAFDRLGRPDVLIHLAWGGLPNYRSRHHFETELPAQYRFLLGLVDAGLGTLVVSGTCFEYGLQSGPLHEGFSALPANPYAFAKDALRRALEFLKSDHPFALTWTRLFYLYGPGQAEASLLPQLRQAVARGDRLFPMSGGEQLRDYLRVEQAADLLVELALGRLDAGIVNVCSGEPISVRCLVEDWIRVNDWQIKPEFGRYPYPDHEPMAFWGDRRKLDGIMGRQ